MAILYPDILEHNNQTKALVDSSQLRGSAYVVNILADTGSIPTDKRNYGMIIYASSSAQHYGFFGPTTSSADWNTTTYWKAFSTGSEGGGGTGFPYTGNAIISGSLLITGSGLTVTGSVNIAGNSLIAGYSQYLPVITNINTALSASYIYVSGSTNDLYFSQNGSGYSNTTRLRWLESILYTGILNGGVLTSTPGSTTFTITSGSGLIVTVNASTASNPYPTVKNISWSTQTLPITYSGSAKISYIGIDNTGTVIQQTTPWGSTDINQWDNSIAIGVVLTLSGSVSTGVFNSPQISYGPSQKTDDFFRAFGPLKISGHTLQASGSTLGIIKSAGSSYREGANYVINPNHPSTVVENSINTSKIYRYYLSGSTPVIDTGVANAGYTVIDPSKYVNTTTGQLDAVTNGKYSLQRVFWVPNSPTNAFIVYYGNANYNSLTDAVNAIQTEPFTEAPNTALNAIQIGYIAVRGGATSLLTAADATILQSGIFRNVGGIGSSGTNFVSATLAGLSDVSINSPSDGQALVYNTAQAKWLNQSSFTGSLYGTATTASYYAETDPVFTSKSASLATTGSNNFNGNQTITGSLTVSGSHTLIGTKTLTGSLSTSGSVTVIGNETITGSLQLYSITSGSWASFDSVNQFVTITGSSTTQGSLGVLNVTSTGAGGGQPTVYIYRNNSFSPATTADIPQRVAMTVQHGNNSTHFWSGNIYNSSGLILQQFGGGLQVGAVNAFGSQAGSSLTLYGPNQIHSSNTLYIGNAGATQGSTWELLRLTSGGNLFLGGNTGSVLFQINQPSNGVGTVTLVSGSVNITGSNTQFTNTFKTGDTITVSGSLYTISTIVSDTSMSLSPTPTASSATQAYTLPSASRFSVYGNGNVAWGTPGTGGTSATMWYDARYGALNIGQASSQTQALLSVGGTIQGNSFNLKGTNTNVISPNSGNNGVLFGTNNTNGYFFVDQSGYNNFQIKTVSSTGLGSAAIIHGRTSGYNTVNNYYASSGNANYTLYLMNPDIAPQGTFSGSWTGFEFNPNSYVNTSTATSSLFAFKNTIGNNIFNTVSGSTLIGTVVDDTINKLQVSGSGKFTGGLTVTGSLNIGPSTLTTTTVTSTVGSNTVFTQATGSYTSAFYKYTFTSQSNARAGEVMAIWNGTSVQYTDNSTPDIGTTSTVSSSVLISGANVVLSTYTPTAGWTIKSQVTYL